LENDKVAGGLGLGAITAIGVGGMVGGGIFAVLGLAISVAGHAVALTLLAGGVIALLPGLSYAQMGLKYRGNGGSFTYIQKGFAAPAIAEVETKRGTGDPMYLYYTLGKLEIMKLRADWKQKQGAAYTIGGFHDALMKQGFAPIKVVRRAMLGDDSPVL